MSNCLKGWAHWLDGLADGMSEQATSQGLQCTVILPSGQNVVGVGEDSSLAVRNLLAELVSQYVVPPAECEPVPKKKTGSRSNARLTKMEKIMHPELQASRPEASTKPRQETIGVTTKRSFHRAIAAMAESRGLGIAELARNLLRDGLQRFDDDCETRDPSDLLHDYEEHARSYTGSETEQWMVRVDRKLATFVRLRAKEFERSASAITSYLIAESLRHSDEAVVAAQPDAISDEEIQLAISVIDSFCKPKAARDLAREVGLGDERTLLNQVFSGTAIAPKSVLIGIASRLSVSKATLLAAFSVRLQSQPVPAYKASDKPEVSLVPQSWDKAVKALHLPKAEEERLLSLE